MQDDHEIIAKCRKCKTCMQERKIAWIGRMLAAEQTAVETWFCTFTYGGGYENERAYTLDYYDLQKCFARIRKRGFRFQYVAVGEYGSEKSRGHFHAIIYWLTAPPSRPMNVRLNEPDCHVSMTCPFWPEGIVQYEHPKSAKAASVYMMDYLKKEDLSKTRLRYSKNPVLGSLYCEEYARERARAGTALFPDGPSFTIPSSKRRNGELFWYRLDRDSSVYLKMLDAFFDEWALCRPTQRMADSDDVREYRLNLQQDTTKLRPHLRRYFQEVYDVHPVSLPADEYTYYTLNDHCGWSTRDQVAHYQDRRGNKKWLHLPLSGALERYGIPDHVSVAAEVLQGRRHLGVSGASALQQELLRTTPHLRDLSLAHWPDLKSAIRDRDQRNTHQGPTFRPTERVTRQNKMPVPRSQVSCAHPPK